MKLKNLTSFCFSAYCFINKRLCFSDAHNIRYSSLNHVSKRISAFRSFFQDIYHKTIQALTFLCNHNLRILGAQNLPYIFRGLQSRVFKIFISTHSSTRNLMHRKYIEKSPLKKGEQTNKRHLNAKNNLTSNFFCINHFLLETI